MLAYTSAHDEDDPGPAIQRAVNAFGRSIYTARRHAEQRLKPLSDISILQITLP